MVRFGVGAREEIEAILAAMLREYEAQEESWRTVLESYMNILMVRILRKINGSGELAGTPENLMWRKLCDYIDANLGEDLTLSTLAGKCFYNPSYFSRAFKDKFRMPLSEYITRRKIDLAARLAARQSVVGGGNRSPGRLFIQKLPLPRLLQDYRRFLLGLSPAKVSKRKK